MWRLRGWGKRALWAPDWWLPTVLAAIFVPLHVAAWAIVLLRVPMGVIPVTWVVGAVAHVARLMWWVWVVL